MDRYNAAYINALSEERDPKILFEWIVKLHKEIVDMKDDMFDLRLEIRRLEEFNE